MANIILGANAAGKFSIPVSVPRVVEPAKTQYDVLDAKQFAADDPVKGIEVSVAQLADMQANTNLDAMVTAGLLAITPGAISGNGVIAGIITNVTTNEPLVGVTGELFTVANPPAATGLSAISTDGGALLISAVPAGAYLLKLSFKGHADQLFSVFVEGGKITNVIKQLRQIVSL